MKRQAPAVARNRQPILDVLRTCLPSEGLVLEIASGTGEHAVHFAQALPALTFQPSDPGADQRASIDTWAVEQGLANIRPALELDARSETWPVTAADAIICINMIHISPWEAAVGLMRGAASALGKDGVLFLYGPYHRDGRPTSPGNESFDKSLRQQDPSWGIRDLEAVTALAGQHGFAAPAIVEMPANNLSLVFRKAASS
jgi:SAM-dependent methyltransferase